MKKIALSLGVIAAIGAPASVIACGKILPPYNPTLGNLNEYIADQETDVPSSDLVFFTENNDDDLLLVYRDGKYAKISYDGKRGWHDFKYDISEEEISSKYKFYDQASLNKFYFMKDDWRAIAIKIELNLDEERFKDRRRNQVHRVVLKKSYDSDKLQSVKDYFSEKIAEVTKEPTFEKPDSKSMEEIEKSSNPEYRENWQIEIIYNQEVNELVKKIANNQADWFKPNDINERPKLELEDKKWYGYPSLRSMNYVLDLSKYEFVKPEDEMEEEFDMGLIRAAYAGYIMKKYKDVFINVLFPDEKDWILRSDLSWTKIPTPTFTIIMPDDEYERSIFYAANNQWALVKIDSKTYYVF